NRFFPKESAPNDDATKLTPFVLSDEIEDQIDPATGKSDIDVAADFMRLLGPPPAVTLTFSAAGGRTLFEQLGCALCHTPMMVTGPNRIAALSMKQAFLYSDLLLHDMGTLGDGIAQADAGTREMRTAPLWGLRVSAPYLHDGRATTVNEAILAHDGEAKNSQKRYLRLTDTQRKQLLEFLNSI
ncbi:MAG: di-heme oxidoredictase family protein, partial [Chthoniobacteraceae bacterium]